MLHANWRLFALPLALGLALWACASPTPSPIVPTPVAGALPTTLIAPSSTPAISATATVAPIATADVAATQFAASLSPDQRVAYAAVQTQFPNEPARWLVAMNETVAAQGNDTPTPLPFPVITEVGQFGVRYRFADRADVERIRDVYERYWDFISFRNGPPPENLAEALGQYLEPSPQVTFSDGECMYADVLGKIKELQARKMYLRLSLQHGIQWGSGDEDVWLIAGGVDANAVRVELRTAHMPGAVIELMDAGTREVIRSTTVDVYLSPMIELNASSEGWHLARDESGVYCGGLWQILNSRDFFRR